MHQGAKACYNVMKYANFGDENIEDILEDILIAYRWKFPLNGRFSWMAPSPGTPMMKLCPIKWSRGLGGTRDLVKCQQVSCTH